MSNSIPAVARRVLAAANFLEGPGMDVFKSLNERTNYSEAGLQFILGAWVLSTLFEKKEKVCLETGDVAEDD